MRVRRTKPEREYRDEPLRRSYGASDPGNQLRVLVSEASALRRDGLAKILEDQPRLEINATAQERKSENAHEVPADAVLLDLALPPGTGTVYLDIDALPGGWIWVVGIGEKSQGERCVVRHDEEGHATLRFGDGAYGARPPSGVENVSATYSVGAGRAGSIDPADVAHSRRGQIELLYTPPTSLSAVTNPVPATGAADPQDAEEIRRSAPATLRVLERAISLADYRALATNLPGVSLAHVAQSAGGDCRLVWIVIGEDCDHEPVAESGR